MFTKRNASVYEVLLYRSLRSHPSFCPTVLDHIRPNGCSITLERGVSNPFPEKKEINKYMKVVLEGLVTLCDVGIIYGDVKIENVIRLENEFKLIDMNIVHFRDLVPCRGCQTFADEAHLEADKSENEVYYYNTEKELVWSIGFLLFVICEGKHFYETLRHTDYLSFLSSPYISDYTPEEWIPFAHACFQPYSRRPNKVRQLLAFVPFRIDLYRFIHDVNTLSPDYSPFEEFLAQEEEKSLIVKYLCHFSYFPWNTPDEMKTYYTFCSWLVSNLHRNESFTSHYASRWGEPVDYNVLHIFGQLANKLTYVPLV